MDGLIPLLKAEQYSNLLQRETLRIVILGPGEDCSHDLNKRRQIAFRLRDRGYSWTMLGEEFLGDPDMPLPWALQSGLPEVDLILVLNTGVAPIVELLAISRDYRGRQITRVWSKREYDQARRSTPGDVLKVFDCSLFSPEEFETCELVESFVATAERFCMSKAQLEGRLTGLGLPPPTP